MILTKISFRNDVMPERVHPGSRARSKFSFRNENRSRTFHKYHAKEVRAHPGAESGTWICWADQLTHSLDPPMFLPHENICVNVE